MPRLRLLMFAIPLLLFSIACGSASTTPTTTSGSTSGNTSTGTAAVADVSAATSSSAVADSSTATSDASSASATVPAGGLKFTLVADQSEASYKATEPLAGISSPTRTPLARRSRSPATSSSTDRRRRPERLEDHHRSTTLTSDKSQRDNYIKRSTLNTDRIPMLPSCQPRCKV